MATCKHIENINQEVKPSADGCEDCLKTGYYVDEVAFDAPRKVWEATS